MIRLTDVHVLKVDPALDITDKHIKQLAENYQTSGHRAPVVIGHPQKDSPAWGWVVSCRSDNDNLYCDLDLTQEFYKLVKDGHYRERSVAFYDEEPYNLRHLGFLGGQPPAIKGLKELTFSNDREYKCVAMQLEDDQKKPDVSVSDFLAPVTLFALSEVIEGVKASNLVQEPKLEDDTISGVVELSDGKRFSYKIVESNGNWTAETNLLNPELVTLSEKVANLENQLAIAGNTAKVDNLYDSNKLTEAILPKKDCLKLVTCSESQTVWKLFNNLPKLVEDNPLVQDKEVTLSESSTLHEQVVAKATELGLNPNNPTEYIKAFTALS
jgi:hypothetical protein